MAAHICHVYCYTPQQLLEMSWRHFLLLAGYIDINERRRARYAALAFNDPKTLFKDSDQDIKETFDDASELLSACN